MKVRKLVSVPTVISPAITLLPPTSSTSPIEMKNERFIWLVELTRRPTRSCASSSACLLALSNLLSSCQPAEKARTTRMPPRFSSMTRESFASRSCRVIQVARSVSCDTDERQATKGAKERLNSPSTTSVESSR